MSTESSEKTRSPHVKFRQKEESIELDKSLGAPFFNSTVIRPTTLVCSSNSIH